MKRFFVRHAKSSAMLATFSIHALALLGAMSFITYRAFIRPAPAFEAPIVERQRLRPRIKPRLPKPPTAQRAIKPPPPSAPRRITSPKTSSIALPPLAMIGPPSLSAGMEDDSNLELGFETEIPFFDTRAKGEKVCFVVHFGPATIGKTPYDRMTGYTIRKRLADIVEGLPEYALFNVAGYWAGDTCAMAPKVMRATSANKRLLSEWMEAVNPLEGDYAHCFDWADSKKGITAARERWPTRVDDLPGYSIGWAFPYEADRSLARKHMQGQPFTHWGRGVAWAMETQKPDTIFVLTTNYIDGWGGGEKGEPRQMAKGLESMALANYGSDKTRWPTINVVVLARAGKDASAAENTLNNRFGPIVRAFKGDASIIRDISKFMNDEEKRLLRAYESTSAR